MNLVVILKFHHAVQGLSPQQIYHVAVMPCFDKKLEASRSDFYMSKAETREVDCVITSGTVAYSYFEVCEGSVWRPLICTAHRCLQERFRKCSRRRTCP